MCRKVNFSDHYMVILSDVLQSCLDDEELEFLIGVSWIEYCQVAHQEGLDVLRYPPPPYPFSPTDRTLAYPYQKVSPRFHPDLWTPI